MINFVIVVVVFNLLIVVHELGHMIAAKRAGVKVERFSLGFGRKLFSIRKGETEFVLSAFPIGGYVKLAGEELSEFDGMDFEFYSKNPFKRFLIVMAGPVTNYLFALIIFISIFIVGFPMLSCEVGRVIADFPAEKAGIKAGDIILQADNKPVKFWDDLVNIIGKKIDNQPIPLKLRRNNKTLTTWLVPKVIKTRNIFGQEIAIGKIGIMPKEKIVFVRHNIFEAIVMATRKILELTILTYKGIWLLVTGGISFKESVAGPIGIGVIIGEAAKVGFISLFLVMAHINIALAIFNLLPIPILDGGHIIFLLIEKLRGRPLSRKTQEMVTQVAFYVLVTLFLFASWNDINRFFPIFKR